MVATHRATARLAGQQLLAVESGLLVWRADEMGEVVQDAACRIVFCLFGGASRSRSFIFRSRITRALLELELD